MTNKKIKDNLKKLFVCKNDFSVTQTNKKSVVNGFYKPATSEIFINNKNFQNDNSLMYTAIHEFTHHYLGKEKGVQKTRHDKEFWQTFYAFVDSAIEQGFYSRQWSKNTKGFIENAKEMQRQIKELQEMLCDTCLYLFEVCELHGERVDDLFFHELGINPSKAIRKPF